MNLKLKTFILEDESNNRELLKHYLTTYFNNKIEIVGESTNNLEALELLKHIKVDLLFLDIELADGLVFKLLNQIDYKKYKLIFITGYSEFAIKAIKYGALDYLLKPIILNELKDAISEISDNPNLNNPILDDFIIRKSFEIPDYILVNTFKEIEKINTNHISHIEADGAYSIIYYNNKKIISSKPIGIYEDILPLNNFHRCHKSFIINKLFINKVKKGRNLIIEINNKIEIPVSIRKKEEFIDWYKYQ